MSVLICGSVAYDTIMLFHDRFKNHILSDQVHILNVSFLVPDMRREFGGCAGNIAYNLKMLGDEPLPMATVGRDCKPYFEWLEQHQIDTRHLKVLDNTYTAQAFITTDQDANQITAFHPGAMNFAHENRIDEAEGVKLGIVALMDVMACLNMPRSLPRQAFPSFLIPARACRCLMAQICYAL